MKTKTCSICKVEETVLFRIKISKDKTWIFVCKSCCIVSQKQTLYVYGGTWKGSKH